MINEIPTPNWLKNLGKIGRDLENLCSDFGSKTKENLAIREVSKASLLDKFYNNLFAQIDLEKKEGKWDHLKTMKIIPVNIEYPQEIDTRSRFLKWLHKPFRAALGLQK